MGKYKGMERMIAVDTKKGDLFMNRLRDTAIRGRSNCRSKNSFLNYCKRFLNITYPETFLRIYWEPYQKVNEQ